METKYIFLDVDGTLINYEAELPRSAVEAIKKVQDNGHKILPLTGRSKAQMIDYILDIGFNGYIGGNGAYIEYEGTVVSHQTLTATEEKEIINWLHENNLEFYLESNSGLYASENFKERGRDPLLEASGSKGKPNENELTVASFLPDLIYEADLYREDIVKISFVLNTYEDYITAKEKFPHLKVSTWGGAEQSPLFGDIGIQDTTKATAVEMFLEKVGAHRKNTFAFGDAEIDNSMIEYCEVGVAMGNAEPGTKAIADYVTDTVDNDGLMKAFEHFGLI